MREMYEKYRTKLAEHHTLTHTLLCFTRYKAYRSTLKVE